MTIPRIYHPFPPDKDTTVTLGGADFRYIRQVLRLRPGATVILFDGRGREFTARIEAVSAGTATLLITGEERTPPPACSITLAQSLPKGAKMDLIVQKTTELGVNRIIPFISSRSVPRLTEEKKHARADRWRKIAREAARQCGRATVPEVTEVVSFDELLEAPGEDTLRLIFWEHERRQSIRGILTDERYRHRSRLDLIVGPEGGFSENEVETARQGGCIPVTLGDAILRTETSPLTIISIVQYERGGFDPPESGCQP
ncbi:MAG: 16S rRNA (uracil(1498)-N(3))-methyltransferase [Deltaproteobacteria bacterium]|nr:16S rRNA (uracil(1498)-N(3))-methyltransferase [Deltaproteobacteria bacterium]